MGSKQVTAKCSLIVKFYCFITLSSQSVSETHLLMLITERFMAALFKDFYSRAVVYVFSFILLSS